MRPSPRTPALLIATLALGLTVGSAGGAVAGSMITGKQIKDGSIKTVDIAPATQKKLRGVASLTTVTRQSDSTPDGVVAQVEASCVGGREVLGAVAFWNNQHTVAEVYPAQTTSKTTYIAFSENVSGGGDVLTLTIKCALRG
ncbi:hypothetical protein BH11ACT8_BH11ACT8_33870 [soil metagenome]